MVPAMIATAPHRSPLGCLSNAPVRERGQRECSAALIGIVRLHRKMPDAFSLVGIARAHLLHRQRA
jgi:light-independent protochlorophyllide reductase subunit N